MIIKIKYPISLAEINKKIIAKEYSNVEELQSDFALMCANAQQYNFEGSEVSEDAIEMQVNNKLSIVNN